MTKEALKLSLYGLEIGLPLIEDFGSTEQLNAQHKAIAAIYEALAQPEQSWTPERIAGMARLKEAQDKQLAQPEQKPMHPQLKAMLEEYFDKCFAESAPQRTWVGLTDEEAQQIFAKHNCTISTHLAGILARAIEAAHGIKENT